MGEVAERRLVDLLVDAASQSLLRSAHDLGDGGLAVALAEACIGGPYADAPRGAMVDLAVANITAFVAGKPLLTLVK